MKVLTTLFNAITATILALAFFVVMAGELGGTFVIGCIAAGLITYYIATKHRGRKGTWSFFYGAAWGIFAVVYYLVSEKE